jgi:hypothetical protein
MSMADTSKATAAAARRAQEARAEWLRERGWFCVAPEDIGEVALRLARVAAAAVRHSDRS